MKILVASDGSEHALHAVKYAGQMARLMRTAHNRITLISVHDDAGLRHAKSLLGGREIADALAQFEPLLQRGWRRRIGEPFGHRLRAAHQREVTVDRLREIADGAAARGQANRAASEQHCSGQ